MRTGLRIIVLGTLWLTTQAVVAQSPQDPGAQELPAYLPTFRFDAGEPGRRFSGFDWRSEDLLNPELQHFQPPRDAQRNGVQMQQFDARLSYPFSSAPGVSLDLGFNIRYLDGVSTQQQEDGALHSRNFREALPMFHATALFDLPFEGLSAGLEGSHLEYDRSRAFDYRAKLKYQWNESFGLEGGWQHQQYSLDQGSEQPAMEYESRGLFLDLFMRF